MSTQIPIEVVPYDPLWPQLYTAESQRILALIGSYIARIEHMGSTAVTGLAAKPVIDILIGVHSLAQDTLFLPPLAALGYEYRPEHESVFPQRRYLHRIINGRRTHHLHMVEPGSLFFKEQLRFRDILRSHPEEAARYAALKYELAAKYRDNRDAYTDGKSSLIREILDSYGRLLKDPVQTLVSCTNRPYNNLMENIKSLEPFINQKYMNIETFRKSGEGVPTPVWFVASNGELCFSTEAGSGKVKRLRRNPHVNIAPCKVNGELLGEWHPATARFMTDDEIKIVDKLYARKYGLMKIIFSLLGSARKRESVFIAVSPQE